MKTGKCTCCFIEMDPSKYPASPYLTALTDVLVSGSVQQAVEDNLCDKHRRALNIGLSQISKMTGIEVKL